MLEYATKYFLGQSIGNSYYVTPFALFLVLTIRLIGEMDLINSEFGRNINKVLSIIVPSKNQTRIPPTIDTLVEFINHLNPITWFSFALMLNAFIFSFSFWKNKIKIVFSFLKKGPKGPTFFYLNTLEKPSS